MKTKPSGPHVSTQSSAQSEALRGLPEQPVKCQLLLGPHTFCHWRESVHSAFDVTFPLKLLGLLWK